MSNVDIRPTTLRQLIDTASARNPQATALAAPGRAPLSYAYLCRHIDATRLSLTAAGITSRHRVALVAASGPELAAAILALAGSATCAPLNPWYRADEFDFCLSTLGATAIIVEADIDSPAREAAREYGIPVIELVPDRRAEAGLFELKWTRSGQYLERADVTPDDIALVMHTSGSTAWPKRVPLSHQRVCASVCNLAAALELTAQDRCLNLKPMYHGAGIATMLAALAVGGSVVCPPLPDIGPFFSWLEKFRPSWFAGTPATHHALLSRARGYRDTIIRCPLRFIRSGTAPLTPNVLRELEHVFGAPVLDAYGMTETGEICCAPLPPRPRKVGSVGLTVGPEVAIMDETGTPVPRGSVGEVVVRGASVIHGYEDAPQANAEAFREGWFRTGDLGVLDADGYLFIKGRLKDLINRGGQKVSPREVEEALRSHSAVTEAVAFPVPHPTLGQDLVAVVVLHSGIHATELDLREFAAHHLADFKVPSRVLMVDEIPKGTAGKIRRQSLAEHFRPLLRPPFVAPEAPLEEALARIWADELEAEHIGINDNFFELGGDSLSATRVCARVQSSLGRPLSVAMLFKTPTVAQLARTLQRQEAGRQVTSSLLAIQTEGSRPPLFCLHGRGGDVAHYFALAHHLGTDQPVYGIQARGVDGTQPPVLRIEDMAALYVKDIQTVFPRGPYLLCGYSFGGLAAWEVAQRLRAENRPVALLALFDTELDQNPSFAVVAHSDWTFFTRRVAFHFDTMKASHLSWHSYIVRRLKARWRRVDSTAVGRGSALPKLDRKPRAPWLLPDDEPEKWPATLSTLTQTNWRAAEAYHLRRYPGRVTLFLARESELRWKDPRLPGQLAAGGVEIRWVPGNHSTLLYEPHVALLASMLRSCIDRVITPAAYWRNIARSLAKLRSRFSGGTA